MGFISKGIVVNLFFTVFFSVFFTVSPSVAHALQPTVSSYLVKGVSSVRMQAIAQEFEVSREIGNGYEVFVPEQKRTQFRKLAPGAVLLAQDISAEVRGTIQRSRKFKSQAPAYHSFPEVVQILNATAVANPKHTQLVPYGQSKLGKPLLALRVSGQLNKGLPRVVLTAATHGDEVITTEILLSLMSTLVKGAATIPRFGAILNQVEVVFIPVVNPDGYSEQNRYDNGEDPNRSYPYPGKPSATPTASIAGFIAFAQQFPLAGSIDFHAYGKLVMYPWAYTTKPVSPDTKKIFDMVTTRMAATNGYTAGQISKVIYVAKGSSADYFFWKYSSLSLGIEVGNSKSPNPSEFPQYVSEQEESTWIFLENFKTSRR